MLRIGDAAKRFDISKRTLRYWEDEGILNSVRAENGYRYYELDACHPKGKIMEFIEICQ